VKFELCRCGTPFVWAKNTKGHFIALELAEVEAGSRFTLSEDPTPVAYSIAIGPGRKRHTCQEDHPEVEQGELGI